MVQLLRSVAFAASFATASFALGPGSPPNTFGNSAVIDLIPDNFDRIALGGKPALVEFFAPWCGHCKTLAPVYEELAQNFAFAKDQVVIAKVDADSEKSLGKRFGVQGFPTIKFFDGKSNQPEDYNGGRDLESLTEFITKKTGVKAKKARAAPSEVEMLTDTSFKTTIGGDKDVLVAFTAPWCGRKLFCFQLGLR
jgi:protein disulfide-isomerase A6